MGLPIYFVASPGPVLDQMVGTLGSDITCLDGAISPDLSGLGPGIILIDDSTVSTGIALDLASQAYTGPPGWCIALVRAEGADLSVRTLSLGASCTLEEAGALAHDPSANRAHLVDLHRALTEVGVLRHSVNNRLTAALAETALLLMDPQEASVKEALEAIQVQLRGIRDLVGSTRHLRPPHG